MTHSEQEQADTTELTNADLFAIDIESVSLSEIEHRLDKFIKGMRGANIFPNAWTDTYWPVSLRSRASSAGDGGLWFTSDRATKRGADHPFPEPFMDFAKAMVCKYESSRAGGHSAGGLQCMISALRYLYVAASRVGSNPSRFTNADFTTAMADASNSLGDGARNVGSRLAFIATTIDSLALSSKPIRWKNNAAGTTRHKGIGVHADKRRNEKMPSPTALDALAAISSNATTPGSPYALAPRDLLVMRAVDILVCTGFRINELLTMPRNPFVEEMIKDEFGNQMLAKGGSPASNLGLRHWPEKDGGAETRVKWLPSAMTDIARRAVEALDVFTAPYALLAKFQLNNPGTQLGSPWDEMNDDTLFSTGDVARAAGLGMPGWDEQDYAIAGHQYIKTSKIDPVKATDNIASQRRNRVFVRKRDLYAAQRARSLSGNVLRRGEGVQDVSDSMFTVPARIMHNSHAAGLNGTIVLLTDAQISVWLTGQGTQKSIFERLDMRDKNGQFIKMTTHQFRHWLNTLALEGGLSEMELARWMGRRDHRQNESYDHVTPMEKARRVQARIMIGDASSPLAEAALAIRDPIDRENYVIAHARTALSTDLGMCLHDWDTLPCPKHGACADCDQHWITKGDKGSMANSSRMLAEAKTAICMAEAAISDGEWKSDRWLDAQRRTAARLETIIQIHQDDRIEDGTPVQIRSDGSYSLTARETKG